MKELLIIAISLLFCLAVPAAAAENTPEPERRLLVTFTNSGASLISGRIRAPYQARRRYAIAAETRIRANEIADEYGLVQEDHWPIGSLNIYCFVYLTDEAANPDDVLRRLENDDRVESAQLLNQFETSSRSGKNYDDTYVHLQHGLTELDVMSVHAVTRGNGINVAMIDSHVDTKHEDLRGQIRDIRRFTDRKLEPDRTHGTAVASIIGARANNAAGIVGVAPDARLDVYVSCWLASAAGNAVCDSFTLAKALDSLLDDPPDVLNMSLVGPEDALIERLVRRAAETGVIVIAADSGGKAGEATFPADIDIVIAVGSAQRVRWNAATDDAVFAPGDHIMVALPKDGYDFRSGSSLAAAHVTGVVALILAVDPTLGREQVRDILYESQQRANDPSIDACRALGLAGASVDCLNEMNWLSKL